MAKPPVSDLGEPTIPTMRSTLLSLMPVGRTTSGICSIALLAGLEFTTRTDARVVWFDEIGGRPRSSS